MQTKAVLVLATILIPLIQAVPVPQLAAGSHAQTQIATSFKPVITIPHRIGLVTKIKDDVPHGLVRKLWRIGNGLQDSDDGELDDEDLVSRNSKEYRDYRRKQSLVVVVDAADDDSDEDLFDTGK